MPHTPGPWEVVPEDRAESRWVIGDEEGGSIASCEPCGPWITPAQADANARLIAAAPDLLVTLHRCVEVLEFAYMNAPNQPKEIAEARTVIAKAELKE